MAQTRQQIIGLLESIGRAPNRKLGQHFMIESALIDRLVAEAGLAERGQTEEKGGEKKGDGPLFQTAEKGDSPLILEVGPGTGTLTESLLAGGAEVVDVEIDEHLADLLEGELGPRSPGRLHLVRGDVLTTKHALNERMLAALSQRAGSSAGRQRFCRLVANLPYNIASPLIAELINLTWRGWKQQEDSAAQSAIRNPKSEIIFDRLVFTVQREVAERLAAAAGTREYGPLSVLCQGLGRITEVVHKISPNAFYPKPNVFSSMLRIDLPADRLSGVKDLDALHAWLEAGFGHRRKTLAASIRLVSPEWQVRLTTAAMSAGIDLTRRGETLSVQEYLRLAEET